jgi:hypothetical protein
MLQKHKLVIKFKKAVSEIKKSADFRLIRNSKAVSEMLSYVLLVIVALGIGALVFSWIIYNLPKETEKCPEGISIIVKNQSCYNNIITLELENKGLFDIYGYFIRASNESGRISIQLEAIKEGEITVEPGRVKFSSTRRLEPGSTIINRFDYSLYRNITNIEIQPFVISGKKVLACQTISQKMEC